MQCFSFTEQGVPFLRGTICQDREPVIPTPEGCNVPIVLNRELTDCLSLIAKKESRLSGFRLGYNNSCQKQLSEWERRVGIDADLVNNTLVVKPPQLFNRRNRRGLPRKTDALVRLETASGVNGRVHLTSGQAEEDLNSYGEVVQRFHSFPPLGVTPLCTPEMLNSGREGVPFLDLFVLMNPGSRFRIARDGELEGCRRTMFVRWTGFELSPLDPAYEERAAGGVLLEAAAE